MFIETQLDNFFQFFPDILGKESKYDIVIYAFFHQKGLF